MTSSHKPLLKLFCLVFIGMFLFLFTLDMFFTVSSASLQTNIVYTSGRNIKNQFVFIPCASPSGVLYFSRPCLFTFFWALFHHPLLSVTFHSLFTTPPSECCHLSSYCMQFYKIKAHKHPLPEHSHTHIYRDHCSQTVMYK